MPTSDIESWIQEICDAMKPPEGKTGPDTPPFYELGEELGHGGMGAVFLARLQPLGVLRALKFLRMPEQASEDEIQHAKDRFLREARIMGNLRHPAAMKALDYQAYYLMQDGRRARWPSYLIYSMEPCLVGEADLRRICASYHVPHTELLEAKRKERHGSVSLQTFLDAKCRFPEKTVARFARELIAMLRSAHEQKFEINDETVNGIVHRDVKPSNILVGPDGRLRLTDFGISKTASIGPEGDNGAAPSADEGRTVSKGTARYAAPEQWDGGGESVHKEADYYSLGIVLYQLLTGCVPEPTELWKEPSAFAKEGTGISLHWDILLRGMQERDPELRMADPDLLDYEFSEIENGRG